jgi:type II secretory pathway predicted ATPase ExeA
MDLSRRCREFWGLNPFEKVTPFPVHLDGAEGLFTWPAFEEVVDGIITAVARRQFLIVSGATCSAKSTAWDQARRRLADEFPTLRVCAPGGLDPAAYTEGTIYSAVKQTLSPFTHTPRIREDRARQVRGLLEKSNADREPVVLAINDAHCCRLDFLLCCKRQWDSLDGYDRLLCLLLIGQPGLVSLIQGRTEISQRSEVVKMPGLGAHIPAYVAHEWARCSTEPQKPAPFDETAWRELGKLVTEDWAARRDHPLIVNRIVSRALFEAWRVKQRTVDASIIAKAIGAER